MLCQYAQEGLNLLQSLRIVSKHMLPSQGCQVCVLRPILSHLRECVVNFAKEANDKLSSSVMQM